MLQESTGRAKFLLDVEFYHHLARRFDELCGGGAEHDAVRGENVDVDPPLAYMLVGLWRCDPRTRIGIPAGDDDPGVPERTLEEWLTALNAAGVYVGLVLWEGRNMSHGVNCYRNSQAMVTLAGGLDRLEVYREPYAGTGIGCSTHQKMFVFWNGAYLEAVVGGFNLHPHFFFQPHHRPLNAEGEDDGESKNNLWHDTAVALTGPVALEVQREWERRWAKKGGTGAAFLDRIHTVEPVTAVDDPYPISLATTNSEAGADEKHIREQVVAAIAAAQNSIYMENYALNDPAILTALTAAMSANPDLNVIIVVNHPRAKNIEGNEVWTYLMWYTFVELSLVRPTSVTAHVLNPDLVVSSFGTVHDATLLEELTVADGYTFTVEDATPSIIPRRHRASPEFIRLYYRIVQWTGPNEGGDYVHNLKDVVGPEVMYSPRRLGAAERYWPYVHSKLALFDDEVAFVGSANWTNRSMDFDGELTAIIRHGATVEAMRTRLLDHWSPGLTLANWRERYHRGAAENGADGDVWMDTLSFDDFIHPEDVGWTNVALVAAWYQPQAF